MDQQHQHTATYNRRTSYFIFWLRMSGNMLRGRYYLFLLIGCLTTMGCTEIYVPELEEGSNILYIEGGITDTTGPHEIILRFSAGYNDAPDFNPAGGARIYLWEDEVLIQEFSEAGGGLYHTDSLFRASPGKSYRLVIETADGHQYESLPQVLPVINLPLDSVYGIEELRRIKYYNIYGDLVLFDEFINQIYGDIPSANENTYYRFDCQLTLEHAAGMRAYPGGEEYAPVDLYMWNSFFPDDLAVIEVNAGRDRLRKFPVTHAVADDESYAQLKYNYYPAIQAQYDKRIRDIIQVEVETDSGIFLVDSVIYGIPVEIAETDYYYGWIVQIDQYSITREAYTFWTDIKKLEETEGEIFDPINTQLRGNMRCTTDPDRPMLGLFEVAAIRETKAFVNYEPQNGTFPGKRIPDMIEFPDNGWNDTIPPPFWVTKVIPGY